MNLNIPLLGPNSGFFFEAISYDRTLSKRVSLFEKSAKKQVTQYEYQRRKIFKPKRKNQVRPHKSQNTKTNNQFQKLWRKQLIGKSNSKYHPIWEQKERWSIWHHPNRFQNIIYWMNFSRESSTYQTNFLGSDTENELEDYFLLLASREVDGRSRDRHMYADQSL